MLLWHVQRIQITRPNFARLADPIYEKVQKDQVTNFGQHDEEEIATINPLKGALVLPPVIALPKSSGHKTLDKDACDKQVGCLLLPLQDDETTRPAGFCSHKHNDTTERECLAIVWSVLILCLYLKGTRFTIRTDQESLKLIPKFTDSTG